MKNKEKSQGKTNLEAKTEMHIYSSSSNAEPNFDELHYAFCELHEEAKMGNKKIGWKQKKIADYLNTLKTTCEKSQKECCETQTSKSCMEFTSCERCTILYQEIFSLKYKLEHASKKNMTFAIKINKLKSP
jgi:hypothetical protein